MINPYAPPESTDFVVEKHPSKAWIVLIKILRSKELALYNAWTFYRILDNIVNPYIHLAFCITLTFALISALLNKWSWELD